ncbi:PilZ domain-containing protein [Vibrio agarivorans]|uniref:PilZ domain-containing protein n=1 Tax=Vibrio agarivorans TaxID=153622 RepID=A0ABT7XYX8_9VIBR|nr:PilZ domain-containing protein [Vibrio agarivorans]MDN2480950.1 PilZ domain-containing protein [Vibrio agarivorans]
MPSVTALPEFEQKRRHFRLRYPKRARPVIRLDDQHFHVNELSEGGVRVEMRHPEVYLPGIMVTGRIALKGGHSLDLEGQVLRVEGNELIVKLFTGPSFKDMMHQQGFVRRHYPLYFTNGTE